MNLEHIALETNEVLKTNNKTPKVILTGYTKWAHRPAARAPDGQSWNNFEK
jgi:hypothetical protein